MPIHSFWERQDVMLEVVSYLRLRDAIAFLSVRQASLCVLWGPYLKKLTPSILA
jgi:hypothetical protein